MQSYVRFICALAIGALVSAWPVLAGPAEDYKALEDQLITAHTDYEEALEKLERNEKGELKPGVKLPPDPRPAILQKIDALADQTAGTPDGLPISMGAFVWSWNFDLDLDRLHARFVRLATHYPDADTLVDIVPTMPLVASLVGKPEPWAAALEKLAEATRDHNVKLAAVHALGEVQLKAEKPALARTAFERVIKLAPESDLAKAANGLIYEIEHLQVGMRAPAFTLKTLDGKEVSLESLRGKAVLLDFWASWCANCIAELPHLRATIKKFAGKPLAVLAVSLDDTREEVESILKHHEYPAMHAWDPAGSENPVGVLYNVQELPTWYLIDADGVIRARDPFGDKLEKSLQEVLSGEGARIGMSNVPKTP